MTPKVFGGTPRRTPVVVPPPIANHTQYQIYQKRSQTTLKLIGDKHTNRTNNESNKALNQRQFSCIWIESPHSHGSVQTVTELQYIDYMMKGTVKTPSHANVHIHPNQSIP